MTRENLIGYIVTNFSDVQCTSEHRMMSWAYSTRYNQTKWVVPASGIFVFGEDGVTPHLGYPAMTTEEALSVLDEAIRILTI